MEKCFSNASVMWNELEIVFRENLIREIPLLIKGAWQALNPVVQLERVETPIITPSNFLEAHLKEDFKLFNVGSRGYLRPETTAGTYVAMKSKFPIPAQLIKRLPYGMWQVGLSFRDEAKPDTMRASRLRLIQFYQLEIQLFARSGTKAPYLESALQALAGRFGGDIVTPKDLPHYSEKTLDWHIKGLEVAGCSIRKDWPDGMVFEVAIGLDRLVALLSN